MTEVLAGPTTTSSLDAGDASTSTLTHGPPPSFQMYLMTGEKIIKLNPKNSSRYAQVCSVQLPAGIEVVDSPNVRKFDEYPSIQQRARTRRFISDSAVPASQSEHVLNSENLTPQAELSNEEQQSSVTVNAVGSARGCDPCGSSLTVESAVSSQCSLNAPAQSPAVERRIMAIAEPHCEPQTSKSEPSSPAKSTYSSAANNFVSNVRCPSPPAVSEFDRRSEVDVEASSRLAKRLFALDGFRKSDVAAHLSKTNDFGVAVAEEYCALFNFSGIRLDVAIRDFLSHFCLIGESQERARIMEHFANRYHSCNPTIFTSSDKVYALACALLLLNSDLHGQNVGKKMSSREFIDNLGQVEHVYDRALLKTLYSSIKEQPIKWAEEEEKESNGHVPTSQPPSTLTHKTKSRAAKLSKSKSTVGEDEQIEYKAGWVVRKCMYDCDGHRTPFGRRSWRMLYGRLRGIALYLHKDENGFRRGRYEAYNNSVSLHHAVAEIPRDYNKRQHVFRLRTANLGEYLFQTSSPQEVQQWIDVINYVAAAFSSRALSPPASNQSVFYKPILPHAPSKLSIPEQLRAHEEMEAEMRRLVEEHMTTAPPLKARGSTVQEYFYKERFLYQERERYELYANMLRSHLSTISPAHSMAIRVERPSAGVGAVEVARSASALHSKPVIYCADVVHEDPEAEARAEQAEHENSDLGSNCSSSSADRSSYKEAIAHSPSTEVSAD